MNATNQTDCRRATGLPGKMAATMGGRTWPQAEEYAMHAGYEPADPSAPWGLFLVCKKCRAEFAMRGTPNDVIMALRSHRVECGRP